MFQFTTTNVINSNKDLTTGKELWKSIDAASGKPDMLNIKRVGVFKKPNVMAIYKAEAVAPEMAKVSIKFADKISGSAGDVFRLNIYVGLTEASQDSRYSNDFKFKGKPFSVDFVWKDNAENTLAALVKTINKYEMMVYGEKLLNVTCSATNLVIEATSEFQRFRTVNIEKFNKTAYHGMGEYVVQKGIEDLGVAKTANSQVTDSADGFFPGKEGFGTYSYLLHNLRIPTSMRTRAFGVNQDETPIVGANYNQYTIHYCVDRGILGSNAVGDAVKSITTHVFYVKSDLTGTFETALGKIGTLQTVAAGTAHTANPIVPSDTAVGNGLQIADGKIAIKVDGDTLTSSAAGVKVTDNKFEPKA